MGLTKIDGFGLRGMATSARHKYQRSNPGWRWRTTSPEGRVSRLRPTARWPFSLRPS